MASLGSLKVVTGGGRGFEGAFFPAGRGIFRPAGQARTISGWLRAEDATSSRTIRVAVNSYLPSGALQLATAKIVTLTTAFQHFSFDIPENDADGYDQVSITTGADGAGYPAITFYADDLALDDLAPVATTPIVDSVSTYQGNNSTFTKSVTVGATSDRALEVVVAYDDHTRAVTGVTYGGTPLTLVKKGPVALGGNVEVWRLLNPPTGTANVVVTHSGSVQAVGGVYVLSNVDQTTPEGTTAVAANSASSTHPTASITAAADELVIAAISIGASGTTTLTQDAGPTAEYNLKQFTTFGIHGAGAAEVGTGSPLTFGWTETNAGSGQPSMIVLVAVKGAPVPAPVNTTAPVVTGDTAQDGVLVTTDGDWDFDPTSVTYQYERAPDPGGGAEPADGSYTAIAGANAAAYPKSFDDVDHWVRCKVTASNGGGSTTAVSNAVGPIVVAAPVNTTQPAAAGPAWIGFPITVDLGGWNNPNDSLTFTFQLLGDDGHGGAFSEVAGATGSSYTPTAADDNRIFKWHVTATNASGSATATSTTVGPIGSATALDTFNGPDENPISEGGLYSGPFQPGGGQLKRADNRLKSSAATGTSTQSYRTDIALADVSIVATLQDVPAAAGRGVGIWARIQNPGTASAAGYAFDYLLGSGFAIFRMTAGGTFAQLAGFNTSHVMQPGERLRFDIVGSQLTGYWVGTDGVAHRVLTATDTVISGPGTFGAEINDANASLDDLEIGTPTPYACSRWIWIPSDYDGTDVRLEAVGFGADVSVSADMTLRDQWQRLELAFHPTVDRSGTIRIREAGATPTAGKEIWVDGCQTEQKPAATPFALDSRADARVQDAGVLDETSWAVVFRVAPGWSAANTPGGGIGRRYLLDWRDDENNLLGCYYDEAAAAWTVERKLAGVGSPAVSPTVTPQLGTATTVIAAGTATQLLVSVDGSDWTRVANSSIPALAAARFDLLSQAGGSQFDGTVGYAATFTGDPETLDPAAIHADLENGLEPWPSDFEERYPGCGCTAAMPFDTTTYLAPGDNGTIAADDADLAAGTVVY